jgi:hypothetical protein
MSLTKNLLNGPEGAVFHTRLLRRESPRSLFSSVSL